MIHIPMMKQRGANYRIPAQLHSEVDASKDGQIRPHIRRPCPAGAGYGRISAGAVYDIRCNPNNLAVQQT